MAWSWSSRSEQLVGVHLLLDSDLMLWFHLWNEFGDWFTLGDHLKATKSIGRKSVDVGEGRVSSMNLLLDDVALNSELEILRQYVWIEILLRLDLGRLSGRVGESAWSGRILLEIWLIWNFRSLAHSMNKLAPNSIRTVELLHEFFTKSGLVLGGQIYLGLKLS